MESRRTSGLLRVAFIDFAPISLGGGYERFVDQMSRWLSEHGCECEIVCAPPVLFDFVRAAFGEKKSRTGFRASKSITTSYVPLSAILGGWKTYMKRFDVVYVKDELPDLILCRLLGVSKRKTVCGFHTVVRYGSIFSIKSAIHKLAYENPLFYWLVSGSNIHLLRESSLVELCEVKYKRRVATIPNGIHMPHTLLRRNNERVTIGFVGRLDQEKGIRVFLKIVAALGDTRHNFRFVIAGSGKFEYEVRRSAVQNTSLSYLGYVEDIGQVLSKVDLLIVPSYVENQPLLIIQGFAYGCVILASNLPSIREIVVAHKTGFLCEVGSVDRFVSEVLRISELIRSNSAEIAAIRTQALSLAMNRYSIEATAQEFRNYLELCAS